jgi:hypothetical protein
MMEKGKKQPAGVTPPTEPVRKDVKAMPKT